MKRLMAAVILGIIAGYLNHPYINTFAKCLSDIFIRSLKFVSLPLISLSILSTVSGFSEKNVFFKLGSKVVKNTLLTTIFSAIVALFCYETIQPARFIKTSSSLAKQTHYMDELIKIFPDNFLRPFLEGQVVGIVIIAVFLGLATLSLSEDHRKTLHNGFQSLFLMFLKVTQWIVKVMPLAIFGFVTLFISEPKNNFSDFALYLAVVFMANGVHALIVLPVYLKLKGLSPFKTAKGMMPALSIAFFSKSSAAAMPVAIECAENKLKISSQVSRFSFPLCTTINMNACAAFMLITVFFIAQSYGMTFSWFDKIIWIGIVTMAAIGNAGVPMGCYFLASALISSMNLPLELMGAILPFYAIIDMFESAINVWSDSCVTAVVDHDMKTHAF